MAPETIYLIGLGISAILFPIVMAAVLKADTGSFDIVDSFAVCFFGFLFSVVWPFAWVLGLGAFIIYKVFRS